VNALDRGLEAIAHAYEAMTGIPRHARWERDFGSTRIALEKRYELVPRGVAVCFTCATFATWNALPSMFASLATGNPVIVKPHPGSVLPMALVVRACQQAFARAGLPRSAILLAVDTPDDPIGKRIVRHPATAIVDFTGSAAFGAWVEQHAWPALSFTETAGLNTVVLESCTDLDPVLRSLATTLCLFSAQMCTSPQNLYVPRAGVRESARRVPAGEVIERLGAALADIPRDARRAGNLLAAIQSPATTALVDAIAAAGAEQGRVVLPGAPYDHPEFPRARTRTPLLVEVGPEAADLYREERFGPISFAILVDDADEGLARATRDVREVGGLTAFVYSQDESFLARATDAYATAGAQLTCNLTGPMPLNFAAAYSDYHVTGLNPAGNASLTDPAFVASRFRIAQSRRPALPG
jgi:phenylacetic acid degradation protein paaN